MKPKVPERIRVLRLLHDEDLHVEWPCENKELVALHAEGLAVIVYRFKDRWGRKLHDCARIAISDVGRQVLKEFQQ